ncbi:DUF1902 domain-containing protein [Arenimonas soli]|nr:DUF1902 domain-containing protein [Arenimonas soli]
MKHKAKRLRFVARRTRSGLWIAHCVDFSLSAQADTFAEARDKIHAQVTDYCAYVAEQQDPEYRRQLLSRKSPLGVRALWLFSYFVHRRSKPPQANPDGQASAWVERGAAIAC